MNIAVLGAGMVGSTIAADLSKSFDVTSFDVNADNLGAIANKFGIKIQQADLWQFQHYAGWLQPFDLVVCAVPGFMGFQALKAIIDAGKNVVDISFFPEDVFTLDTLAKEKNVTAITDCGVAPGLSNWVVGYHNERMQLTKFECMVGGLPKIRTKPWEYKAPFSPIDVIEEYSRPARYMENGQIITRPALSDAELIDFEYAGTLESFNTDGLRSILITMKHVPNMKEKTLRYPGHIALIQSLQKAGFLSEKEIEINGKTIRPIDLTSKILFDQWKLQPGEAEFTIMTIACEGIENNQKKRVEYFLYDENDTATGFSSMSRTTGFTCTAAVHLMAENMFKEKGVFPPELVAATPGTFEFVLKHLAERNVLLKRSDVVL